MFNYKGSPPLLKWGRFTELSKKQIVQLYNEISLPEFLETIKPYFAKESGAAKFINYMLEQNKNDNYPESNRYSDDIVNMFDCLGISEEDFLKYSK